MKSARCFLPCAARASRARRPLLRLLASASALAALSAAVPDAAAAYYYWTGATSNDWTAYTNWATAADGSGTVTRLPGAGDDVYQADNPENTLISLNNLTTGTVAANIHNLGFFLTAANKTITFSGKNEFIDTFGTTGQGNLLVYYTVMANTNDTTDSLIFTSAASLGYYGTEPSGLVLFPFHSGNIIYQGESATIAGLYIQSHTNDWHINHSYDSITVTNPNAILTINRYVAYSDSLERRRININGAGTVRLADTEAKGRNARVSVWGGNLILDATLKDDGTVHAIQAGGGVSYALYLMSGTVKIEGPIKPAHADGNQINSGVQINGGVLDLNGRNERFTLLDSQISASDGIITNNNASAHSLLIVNGTARAAYTYESFTTPATDGYYGAITGNLSLQSNVGAAGEVKFYGRLTYTGETILSNASTFTVGTASGANKIGLVNFVNADATLNLTDAASTQIAGFTTSSLAGTLALGSGVGAFIIGGVTDFSGAPIVGADSFEGKITGSRTFEKRGSDTFTLLGDFTAFTGAVTVSEGTLALAPGKSLAGAATISIGENARFSMSSANAGSTNRPVIIAQGGEFEIDSEDIFTINGQVSGDGSVVKKGAGTLFLANADSEGINVRLDEGAFSIGKEIFGDLTAADRTSLNLLPTGSRDSALFRNITLNGNLGVDISGVLAEMEGDTTRVLAYTGVLVLNNNGKFVVNDAASFRAEPTLEVVEAQKEVILHFPPGSAPANLVWNGIVGANEWNFDDNNKNWLRLDGTGEPERFYANDRVIFNDNAAVKEVIIPSGLSVIPSNITVNNSGGENYTFTGEGSIKGVGMLIKRGGGILDIETKNTYSGGTVIEGGTVRARESSSLGTGTVTFAGSGATLQLYSDRVSNVIHNNGYDANLDLLYGADAAATHVYFDGFFSGSGKVIFGAGNNRTQHFTSQNNSKFTGTIEARGSARYYLDGGGDGGDWSNATFLLNDTTGVGTFVFFEGVTQVKELQFTAGNMQIGREEPNSTARVYVDKISRPNAVTSRDVVVTGTGKIVAPSGTLTVDTGGGSINFVNDALESNGLGLTPISSDVGLLLVKEGAGRLKIRSASLATGIIVNGGELYIGTPWGRGTAGTGLPRNQGAQIIINSGGILRLACFDVWGGADGSAKSGEIIINEGGLFVVDGIMDSPEPTATRRNNALGKVFMNGGTMRNEFIGGNMGWGAITLDDTITVNGSVTSTIEDFGINDGSGIRLDAATGGITEFNVERDPADGSPGLRVTAVMGDANGASGLLKTGPGRMIVTGNNVYSGTTTIREGVFQVGENTASGTLGSGGGAVTVLAGATLVFSRSDVATISNAITSDGTLINRGGGVVTLSGNFSQRNTGYIRLENGGLTFTNVGSGNLSSAPSKLEMESGTKLTLNAGTLTLAGNALSYAGHTGIGGANDISGAGTLLVSDGHTLRVGSAAGVAGDTLVVSNFVVSGAHLQFTLEGSSYDTIKATSTFSVSGSKENEIELSGDASTWLVGKYPIIDITGSGSITQGMLDNNFHLDTSAVTNTQYALASLVLPETGTGGLYVKVIKANRLIVWNNESNPAEWDNSTANWREGNAGSNSVFTQWDAVEFNDAYNAATKVRITDEVFPFSVTVDTAGTYYLTNTPTGAIAGQSSLIKRGSGTLILGIEEGGRLNTFSRNVIISEGVLEVGGTACLLGNKRVGGEEPDKITGEYKYNADSASLLGTGGDTSRIDRSAEYIQLDGGTLRFNGAAGNTTTTNRSFTVGVGDIIGDARLNGGAIEIASTAPNTRVWFEGGDPVALLGAGNRTLTLTGEGGADGYNAVLNSGALAAEPVTAGGILGLPLMLKNDSDKLAVEKKGAGVWHITNADNTYNGGTVLREGGLAVGVGGTAESGPLGIGAITFAGGNLVVADIGETGELLASTVEITLANALVFNGGGGVLVPDGSVLTLSGSASGAGALVKRGKGLLLLTSAPGNFTGGASVLEGVLEVRQRQALGDSVTGNTTSGLVAVETGGTLVLNRTGADGTVTVSGVASETSGGGVITSGRAAGDSTLAINVPGGVTAREYFGKFEDKKDDAGAVVSRLGIIKTGLGTQILSGVSTYTGATRVQGGVLRLGNLFALGTEGEVSVESGGTLDIAGLNFATKDAAGALLVERLVGVSGGTVADSTGGGVFPRLTLAGDSVVRTGGETAFTTVAGAHTLSLDAYSGSVVPPVFVVNGDSSVNVSEIKVNAGVLRLDASNRLSGAVAGDDAVLILSPGSSLHLSGRDIEQTFGKIEGEDGDITGFGTVHLVGSVDGVPYAELDGRLRDSVSLTLDSGHLELTNSANETDGTITVGVSSTLHLRQLWDVLGNATLAFSNGTVSFEVPAGALLQMTHNLYFEGGNAVIQSNDTGAVRVSGETNFGTGVGDYLLTLSGASTAENILAIVLKDPDWIVGAKLSLVKDGNGTWVLEHGRDKVTGAVVPNSYTGGTTIARGTLKLGAENAIPAGTAVTLGTPNQAGVLDLNGYDIAVSSLSRTQGSAPGTTIINSDATRTPVFAWHAEEEGAYDGGFGSSGGGNNNNFIFEKTGGAKLTLGGALLHTGDTRVREGTLAFASAAALPAGARILVSPKATLDATPLADGFVLGAGKTIVAGSAASDNTADLVGAFVLDGGRLVIGDAAALDASNVLRINGSLTVVGASFLDYNLNRYPGDAGSILKTDTLNLEASATIRINMVRSFITPGEYTLVEYGALNGDFTLLNIPDAPDDPRYSYGIVNRTDISRLVLNVTSYITDNPVFWVGGMVGGETEWSSSSSNFHDDSGLVGYGVSSSAVFDDTAAGFDVNVGAGNVIIGAVLFENKANDYTLSGPGSIEGEGIIEKRGVGTLTINIENAYRGRVNTVTGERYPATVLAEGTLALGHDKALGPDALLITGGVLARSGSEDRAIANEIIIGGGQRAAIDAGDSGTFTLNGVLRGGEGANLTKAGTGTLLLNGDAAGYEGTLTVGVGRLVTRENADLSRTALVLDGSAPDLVLGGGVTKIGALSGETGARITADKYGEQTIETGQRGENTEFAGEFDDSTDTLSLTKVGAGKLTLTGENSGLSGRVVVKEGVLQLGDGLDGSFVSGSLRVDAGAKLVLNLRESLSFSQNVENEGEIEKLSANTLALSVANDTLGGVLRVSAGILSLQGAGTFGTARLVNNASIELNREDSYVFANDISGSGTLFKNGVGEAVYLGSNSGSGATFLREGALRFGDDVTYLKNQQHLAAIETSLDTALFLSPSTGTAREPGKITLGNISGAGRVEKTGGGLAVLTGLVQVHNALNGDADILVREGSLSIGNGEARGSRATLHVASTVKVLAGATLAASRTGATYFDQPVTSEGLVDMRGDLNGDGLLVFASAANQITGVLEIHRTAVVQIGDAAAPARLNDGSVAVEVALDPNATLRFTRVASGETGAGIVLYSVKGEGGIVEYNGGGFLRFNSATSSGADKVFTGTFLAGNGTFAIDAASLPPGATLDATGSGNLFLGADADTALAPRFGAGDGVITLGANNTAVPVTYTLTAQASFGGVLAVGESAALRLTGTAADAVTASVLRVENGARLSGNGFVSATLHNRLGGVVHPGNSVGQITVFGNFLNEGALEFDMDGASSYSTIHYSGSAVLDTAGSLTIRIKKSVFDALPSGHEFKFLVDDEGDVASSVTGNFSQNNISLLLTDDDGNALDLPRTREILTYNKGDGGLTLLFASRVGDIRDLRLHTALDGFENYLSDDILGGNDISLIATVSRLLGSNDVSRAFNAASPVGLAAMTAMPVRAAHEASATLHSHLESLRYGHPVRATQQNIQPYILGTGFIERNGGDLKGPAFDQRSYGGFVGADYNAATGLVLGANIGYSHGQADLAFGAGRVKHDSFRGTIYGSCMLNNYWYADASVFAGYGSYELKHQTQSGLGEAKPDGYDFGATFSLGAVLPFNNRLHLTPYAAVEYDSATVEGFTERGHEAALRVYSFSQDSLRARFGSGFNWQVPTGTEAYTLRLGFDLSYAHELLDADAPITARFANDTSGNRFRVNAPAIAEDSLRLGPTLDLEFAEDVWDTVKGMSIHAGYHFEYDFRNQQVHQVNAAFRMRF